MALIYIFDLCGVGVFTVAGAILATRKKMDLFGVIVVGFVTAVGGGSIRDLLLGRQPVFWLLDINYIIIVLISSIVTFVFYTHIKKINNVLSLFDAVGLGVFTVIGIQKSLSVNLLPVFAIVMGVTTAVAGGAMRDILCQEIPLVLRKEVYATACLIGGVSYFFLRYLGFSESVFTVLSIVIIVIIRVLAIKLNLSLPRRGGFSEK